jgi:hypothetical protein
MMPWGYPVDGKAGNVHFRRGGYQYKLRPPGQSAYSTLSESSLQESASSWFSFLEQEDATLRKLPIPG